MLKHYQPPWAVNPALARPDRVAVLLCGPPDAAPSAFAREVVRRCQQAGAVTRWIAAGCGEHLMDPRHEREAALASWRLAVVHHELATRYAAERDRWVVLGIGEAELLNDRSLALALRLATMVPAIRLLLAVAGDRAAAIEQRLQADTVTVERFEVAMGVAKSSAGGGPDRLEPADYAALALVLAGEPLEVDLLERLVPPDVVASLLARGWLVGEQLTPRRLVELTDPARRAAARRATPAERLVTARLDLALALEATGVRRVLDKPRLAAWRLAAGDPQGPAAAVDAMRHAVAAGITPLASLIAELAVDAAGEAGALVAGLVLARTSGLFGESSRALDRALLYWSLGRPGDASEVLRQAGAAREVGDPPAALVASAVMLFLDGDRWDEVFAPGAAAFGPDAMRQGLAVVSALAARALAASGYDRLAEHVARHGPELAARLG